MNSLIVFAAIIACASASSLLLGQPLAYHAPAVITGSYKERTIIPQPSLIKQYARTDVVGVAPVEHGVTIKHYSAHPAGFGYSHRSYGINGVRGSDSYVAQPEHLVAAKTVAYAAAPVAYAAAPLAYAPAVAYGAPAAYIH